MKKKVYFMISSILQIIGALYIIITAQAIINTQLEMVSEAYSMFPAEFQERVTTMFQNGGVPFLRITSVITIVLNAIILKAAITNKILPKKGLLIAFSVLCFVFSSSTIGTIFSIVNFIVLLCLQRKTPEDYPSKEKKEIPSLDYHKPTRLEFILGIVFVLAYFSQFLLRYIIPDDISFTTAMVIQIGIYVVLFIIAILAFGSQLKRDFMIWKDNSKAYLQYLLPKIGIMYALFLVSNLVCLLITRQATSQNQETLESMPRWFIVPASIIWAPIVEELVFRGMFRRVLKNDTVFILVSAVVFGLMHTISEVSLLNVFVMMIPYAILGGTFAYLYAKTNNITNNILAHAFQNTVAMLFLLMLL